MDFKNSFRFLIILLFTFFSNSLFSQSELEFDDVLEISFTYSGGINATTQSFTVPQNQVYKITSAGCGNNEIVDAVNTNRANVVCDLHLNGNIIYKSMSGRNSPNLPIWLGEGSYTLQLFVNAGANTFNGFIYGLKFNKK